MKSVKMILCALVVASTAASSQAAVILTGVIDGSASSPKGVEIYVEADGTDLTGYTIEVESNGGSSWNGIYNFDQFNSGVYDQGFYYITSTDTDMIAQFPSATASNTIADSSFNQNGNDAFRILDAGDAVVDQYGDPADVSGSSDYSADWAYNDSYAYRVNETGPDGGYTPANWTFGGSDAIDQNGGDDTLFPAGSYAPVPEPASLALLALGGLAMLRRK